MKKTSATRIQKASLYIFYGLLAYMPLHIFLSTVIGVKLHTLEVMKIAKDMMLVFGFCLLFFSSIQYPWCKDWLKNKLIWVILAYATLTVMLALIRPTDQDAEMLGVVYNTRFLLFFLYGWLLMHTFPTKQLQKTALKIVLGVGLVVVVFGIVQYLFLPNDALTHFGYSRQNGVLPAFFIDAKPNLERVMSTLRDPNSLGSYLIIIGSLVWAALLAKKSSRKGWVLYEIAVIVCLWFTFSRSAWLGYLLASGAFIALLLHSKIRINKKQLSIIGGSLIFLSCIVLAGLYTARNSYFVQNVVVHADKSTQQADPNELRIHFWKESIQKVADNPVGAGPGTAGLASIRNQVQGTQLNENYYLQIADEAGVLGLVLFLVIAGLVAIRLYRINPDSPYAWALLASFAGLALTNFLVHIWSNEAVAYTWWGLAGLYMVQSKKIKI